MMDIATTVDRAAHGDRAAFNELIARHRGVVYAICLSQVGHAAEAQDLAQEVFVRVYRDLSGLRAPQAFVPWLRQVAMNVCRSSLRRHRGALRPLEAVAEEEDPAAARRLRRAELAQIVSEMLARVSPNSREVLALRYLADCSEKEIATALDLSLATVKSRLYEGRQQAKRALLPAVRELLSVQESSDELADRIMAGCASPGCVCPDALTEGR